MAVGVAQEEIEQEEIVGRPVRLVEWHAEPVACVDPLAARVTRVGVCREEADDLPAGDEFLPVGEHVVAHAGPGPPAGGDPVFDVRDAELLGREVGDALVVGFLTGTAGLDQAAGPVRLDDPSFGQVARAGHVGRVHVERVGRVACHEGAAEPFVEVVVEEVDGMPVEVVAVCGADPVLVGQAQPERSVEHARRGGHARGPEDAGEPVPCGGDAAATPPSGDGYAVRRWFPVDVHADGHARGVEHPPAAQRVPAVPEVLEFQHGPGAAHEHTVDSRHASSFPPMMVPTLPLRSRYGAPSAVFIVPARCWMCAGARFDLVAILVGFLGRSATKLSLLPVLIPVTDQMLHMGTRLIPGLRPLSRR